MRAADASALSDARIEEVGPNVPLLEIHTMAEEVDNSTSSECLTAGVASLFGVVAMFLVGVGLYGVLVYFVGQRLGAR